MGPSGSGGGVLPGNLVGPSHPYSNNFNSNYSSNPYSQQQLPTKSLSPGLSMASENIMAENSLDAMVSGGPIKAGGPMKPGALYTSRSNPYPSAQQHYMQNKRAQFPAQVSMPVGMEVSTFYEYKANFLKCIIYFIAMYYILYLLFT